MRFNKLASLAYRLSLAIDACKVERNEIESELVAKVAVDKEWERLASIEYPDNLAKGVWDIESVREKAGVRWSANKLGIEVFSAAVAKLCYQKDSELRAGDPGRVYKGRHVFWGANL